MSKTSFRSAWAKVEWAKEHRDALDKYIRETFAVESNRPRLGAKLDPKTSEHVLYVNYVPPLNDVFERVSLILGDAAHNLRSALDHLAVTLADWNMSGSIKKDGVIQFPICDYAIDFAHPKDGEAVRRLSELDAKHVAIIERYQPYHRLDETS